MRILRRADDAPRRSLWQRLRDIALFDVGTLVRGGVTAGSLERLEELLLDADFGVPVSVRLVGEVEAAAKLGYVRTQDEFLDALRRGVETSLSAGTSDPALALGAVPTVILVVGVNGAGKTTFIAKLASRLRKQGKQVVVAAGDTYRAGAIDQLRVWADRVGAQFVGSAPGSDPAAVAYNAIDSAVARRADVVIVDTAGRLHTQDDLMGELTKIRRVIAKQIPEAPHETLLTVDATTGQNGLRQAQLFSQAIEVDGLVLTKLDGTAKGGIALAIAGELGIPVKLIGVGEQLEDLRPFDAGDYARALIS